MSSLPKAALNVAARVAFDRLTGAKTTRLPLQDVLTVAASLIDRKGFGATSIADIGAALGVSPAAVYTYVKSKTDLLKQLVLRSTRALRDTVRAPAFDRLPAPRALEKLVREHCREVFEYPADLRELVRARREVDRRVAAAIEERERTFVAAVKRVVERGIRTRSFRTMDPSVATQLTLDCANSMLRWYRPNGKLSRVQVVDEIWHYIAGALGIKARAKRTRQTRARQAKQAGATRSGVKAATSKRPAARAKSAA